MKRQPLSRTERVISVVISVLLVIALISVAELGRMTARPFVETPVSVESKPTHQEQDH